MLGDFFVHYSLLHTYAIWCSLLLLGYKPVQHVTVLWATVTQWYYNIIQKYYDIVLFFIWIE